MRRQKRRKRRGQTGIVRLVCLLKPEEADRLVLHSLFDDMPFGVGEASAWVMVDDDPLNLIKSPRRHIAGVYDMDQLRFGINIVQDRGEEDCVTFTAVFQPDSPTPFISTTVMALRRVGATDVDVTWAYDFSIPFPDRVDLARGVPPVTSISIQELYDYIGDFLL